MLLHKLVAAAALMLSGLATAQTEPPALRISADAQGQLLIFPYYTTAAGNSTLLTLTNYDVTNAKVLRVRVAEGENGQDVLSFHLYLHAGDAWTGVLFDRGETQTPGLLTQDLSCTVPALRDSEALPQLPDGRRYTPLRGGLDDGGSVAPARLREGFIEVLEVATIVEGTATASAVAPPRNCGALLSAWTAPDGYWRQNPLAHLANPAGRIGGEAAVVNVAAGTVFGLAPVVIDHFRSVMLHKLLDGREAPLSTLALTDAAAGTAAALINQPLSGQQYRLTYPAPSRAVDAVSAVLMVEGLNAAYEDEPGIGARTSYVLTYPTRPLYTDEQYTNVQTGVAPFRAGFQGPLPLGGSNDSGMRFRVMDRESAVILKGGPLHTCGFLCQPMPAISLPGTAVEVLAPVGTPDPLLGTRLHGQIRDTNGAVEPVHGSGFLQLDVTATTENNRGNVLRPSLEGHCLRGLPVIGTRLISYVNANVSAGVLANYSTALPMVADTSPVEPSAFCRP